MKKMLCTLLFVLAACPGPEQKDSKHYDTVAPSAVHFYVTTQDLPSAGVVQQRAVVAADGGEPTVPVLDVTNEVTGENPSGFLIQRITDWQTQAFTYVILVGHTQPFDGVEFEVECSTPGFDASINMTYTGSKVNGEVVYGANRSTSDVNDYTDTFCQNGAVVWETVRPAAVDMPWIPGFADASGLIQYEGIDQNLYWAAVTVGRAWADPNQEPPTYTIHRVGIVPQQAQ